MGSHRLSPPAAATGHLRRFVRGRWFGPVIGLLCLVLSAAITAWTGVPPPAIQDEPSYLLAADTFAHGRLTNPPHAMARHFETFHVLHRPTYMSKYPPAQGAMLALGQVLAGEPIVGAWLAAALAAGAIAWALRQWLPPRWALAGASVALAHPLLVLVWGQNYWGGSVPTLGGALVAGALRRLWRRPSVGDGVVMAIGIVALGLSRPYEGGLFTLMMLTPMVVRYVRRGWFGRADVRRAVLAGVAIVATGVAFQGYYNYRVTGRVLELPYMTYERQYNPVPLFVWQGLRHAELARTPNLAATYENETRLYHYRRTPIGFARNLHGKSIWIYRDYVSTLAPVLVVPLLGALLAWRRQWVLAAAAVTLALFGIVLLSNATLPHYVAPATVLFFFLVTAGWRAIWRVRVGGVPVGRWVVGVTLAAYVGTSVYQLLVAPQRVAGLWSQQRQVLQGAIEEHAGEHLVLVRYVGPHHPGQEWVFNSADIDGQRTVWAHDLGGAENRELLAYYPRRRAWVLTVSPEATRVDPYGAGASGE